MTGEPINPDREQQRADNIASRRQSGLEPLPKDQEENTSEGGKTDRGSQEGKDRDEIRRRIEAASGGEPVKGLELEEGESDDRSSDT